MNVTGWPGAGLAETAIGGDGGRRRDVRLGRHDDREGISGRVVDDGGEGEDGLVARELEPEVRVVIVFETPGSHAERLSICLKPFAASGSIVAVEATSVPSPAAQVRGHGGGRRCRGS